MTSWSARVGQWSGVEPRPPAQSGDDPGRARFLPRGSPIADELWRSRHRTVIRLLWLHVLVLGIYGTIRDFAPLHLSAELGAIALITAAAQLAPSRFAQSSLGTLGLVSCSGLLVHLSGGL